MKRSVRPSKVFNYTIIFATIALIVAITGCIPKSPLPPLPWSLQKATEIVNTSLDASIPDDDTKILTMDGSATMVSLIQELRFKYQQAYPNKKTTYGLDKSGNPQYGDNVKASPSGSTSPSGSNKGLENLSKEKVLMAAISRKLNDGEEKDIVAVPIARDAITVIVDFNNPFKGDLTIKELKNIYLRLTTNWGRKDWPIKVYNRHISSGTRETFKDLVLGNAKFPDEKGGTFPDNNTNKWFETWGVDEDTPVVTKIQEETKKGIHGIYYTNISYAKKQDDKEKGKLVRIVRIDGFDPKDEQTLIKVEGYPLVRTVYLAARKKTTASVKQFLEFVLSPEGQNIVKEADFIPLPP
jgi:phosphate transport system substrate-binding protein